MDVTQEHGLITIPYAQRGIPVYRTCTDRQDEHPAIVLIHEVWGLTDHIKSVADHFCREGYEVIAPDLLAETGVQELATPELQRALFDPEEKLKHQAEIRQLMAPLSAPGFSEETIKKLLVCFDYLDSEPTVTKIGVVGFCFGGTYSFGLAAQQPQLSAAIPFYGHGEQWVGEFSKINCPILAFYGEADTNLNQYISEIEEAMKAAGKNFTYKIYPGVGHAFFNETNPLTYNKQVAKDAWERTLDFLGQNLR